jgi:hypothetical protein
MTSAPKNNALKGVANVTNCADAQAIGAAWVGMQYWCASPGLIDLDVLTFFGTVFKGF